MPLSAFTPQVRDWFERAFAAPTPAQAQAWPAIATGEHTLISAPTGSGKTLAAFLWALDRLVAEPTADRTRLVYVSPLKALSYDVEKNLRAPLRGIGADVKVAIRTGDTPQRERQAMLRHPPDILITTPESLYLMLTSQAQRIFEAAEQVIVDEIHAVAQTKRGAHLALTLERLAEAAGRDVQRIGLSATQNPLEEVGRFLVGPKRTCTVVDTGVRKPLDLKIHVPVESMVEPDSPVELDPFEGTGQEATRKSIWPAMYPKLLELVRAHRSTLIFVNNRRGAERLALRLNELAAGEAEGVAGDEREARGRVRGSARLMAVTIKLPTQLRGAAGGAAEARADGATVGEVLDGLYAQHGELRDRLSDGDGGLRRFVNVYVDGEDIRFGDGLDTPVADGQEVQILPAVAGG